MKEENINICGENWKLLNFTTTEICEFYVDADFPSFDVLF